MRQLRAIALVGLLLVAGWGTARAGSTGVTALLSGVSGKLRAVFTLPGNAPDGAPSKPGVYRWLSDARQTLTLIVLTPFSAKVDGRIGAYRMGQWPFERIAPRDPAYENPPGFIEVTPENFRTQVSEHFTLGQFVTKGQDDVWPKYLALDRRLVDKLELTIDELRRSGHPVAGLVVMSGFRTPEYNEYGGDPAGRSAVSRHMYGDAADVFPDDTGRGWISDLNHDGRCDIRDARIVAAAAEAVEARHPELSGGIGVYPGAAGHGPFVHIDARGHRARWGG
ncbi:MAG TPA: hypothetical protein VEG84_09160 [Thermoanaerobaculia bacterium]|nr:hypothetical protein [Thermoanaerobaculia bacterium]